jgi:hypothetical protein
MNDIGGPPPRSAIDILFTIAGATGIAALFMPFYWDVSPVAALSDFPQAKGTWMVGAPFLLAAPILVACAVWIARGRFAPIARAILYALAAAAGCVTVALAALALRLSEPSRLRTAVIVALATLTVGLVLLIKDRWRRTPHSFNPVVAMQVAYIANALFCLVYFYGSLNIGLLADWEIGAYMAFATIVVYLAQMISARRVA